jgi:hypothetical protein
MIEVQKVAKKPQGELRLGASEKYRLDGGLCLSSQESAIKLTQSPYIENMNGDDKGALIGRMGQANVFTLAGGAINGAYPEYKGYSIFAHGTKLYKQLGSATPEEIYSSLTDSKAFLFVFNGILYLMNGHEYIQYDGVTVKPVEAYIPEAVESRKPDGTQSTLKEPLNLFGDWWSESFSSDGTTVYHLTAQNLEAIGEVKVNGVVKTLTTDYTVDVAKGLVTFNTAIPESIPNNVKIKCKKSNPEGKAAILGCTFGEEFGGSLWITGNPATPNKLWKTGLTDYNEANYFPASGRRSFEIVGGADKAIT